MIVETALGRCQLTWSERGLTGVTLLAAGNVEAGGGASSPPPPWVQRAADLLVLHLAGSPQDLSEVPLDAGRLPPFHRAVYEAARRVGPGSTVSYGELAAMAGSPGAARAVGQALARNPFIVVVPCHRVLAAGGRPGGFSAPGGLDTKARLLAVEGREISPRPPRAASRAARALTRPHARDDDGDDEGERGPT